MLHPAYLHHRSRKFWTRVEFARATARAPAPIPEPRQWFWKVVLVILAIAILIAGGCRPNGSVSTRVTGTELVKAETYVKLSWQQATGAMRGWLDSALTCIHSAAVSNDAAADEYDELKADLVSEKAAHKADVAKRDAEIKDLKSMTGYRVEMFIRRLLSILKWLAIGFAAWGIVGGVLNIFAPGIGGLVLGPWLLVVKFILRRLQGAVMGHPGVTS